MGYSPFFCVLAKVQRIFLPPCLPTGRTNRPPPLHAGEGKIDAGNSAPEKIAKDYVISKKENSKQFSLPTYSLAQCLATSS
jgi:hypothetical protein